MHHLCKWTCSTLISVAVFLPILSGCGHNRFNEYKTWGLAVSIPFGDLGSLGIGIGSIESTTAMVRGGSSFNSQTISGEGLFAGAGGTAKVTTFKANEQLNEGNIVKVMESPDVPPEAKQEIAKNINPTAPDFAPSAMQIREASLYSNGFTNELTNQFKSTGVDKVVEEVTDTAEKVIDNATSIITDTGGDVIDAAKNTVDTISDHLNPGKRIADTITDSASSLKDSISKILMIVVVCVVGLLLAILIVSIFKRKPKHRQKPVTSARAPGPIPPEMMDDEEPADLHEEMHIHTQEMPFSSQVVEDVDLVDPHPIKNAILNFWYGFLEMVKSLLFFWKDLDQETRDAAIDAGRKFFRKDEPKKEDEQK